MARGITSVTPGRLAVDELPELAKKAKLLRFYSDGHQSRAKAELIQPLHRVREDIKSDAEFFDLAGRLVDF